MLKSVLEMSILQYGADLTVDPLWIEFRGIIKGGSLD